MSRESLAAMRHHARRDAADDPDAIPVALRVIERGVAPTPRFSREDTLDAVRRFGGFDARDAPPPALARAADVAMEALAYATRHMAWAGAASAVLCQGRFRNLNGGVGGGVKGRAVDGVTGHAVHASAHSASAHSASAHSAHSVRLDASTVRSLHLVRGGEGVGRAGSLLAYLDVAVTGPGRRRLREWILQPLRRVAAAEARHDAVDALVDRPNVAANLRAALAAIPSDAQRGIARATALAKALEDASEAARERGAAKVSTVGGGNAESISGNVSGFDAFDGFDVGAARGPTRRPVRTIPTTGNRTWTTRKPPSRFGRRDAPRRATFSEPSTPSSPPRRRRRGYRPTRARFASFAPSARTSSETRATFATGSFPFRRAALGEVTILREPIPRIRSFSRVARSPRWSRSRRRRERRFRRRRRVRGGGVASRRHAGG